MTTEIVLLLMGAGFMVVGVLFWQKGQYLLNHGKRAHAQVIGNVAEQSRKGGTTYYPVVTFVTDQQKRITQQLNIGYSHATPVNKEVEVLYDPQEPNNVQINTPWMLSILPALFVIIGIVLFGAGLLLVLDVEINFNSGFSLSI